VTKDLEKVIATKWKEYLKCKKTASATATDASGIAACVTGLTGDAKVASTVAKLTADIGKDCGSVTIAADFAGACSSSTAATLAACLDKKAECRICLALNATDGLSVNCDLFDDGVANSSCPPCTGEPVGGFCWFLGAPGASCDATCAGLGEVCDAATITYAGTGGTTAQCGAVLTALAAPGPFIGDMSAAGLGVGCDDCLTCPESFRDTSAPTTCAATDPLGPGSRVCACH
jgi:hypothetical protein